MVRIHISMSNSKIIYTEARVESQFEGSYFPSISIRIPRLEQIFLYLYRGIVESNVSMLCSINVLRKEHYLIDDAERIVLSRYIRWSIPVNCEECHMFIERTFSSVVVIKSITTKSLSPFLHISHGELLNYIEATHQDQVASKVQ